MAYVRFVLARKHPDSGVAEGLFSVAYSLRDAEDTRAGDRDALDELLAWFKKHLPMPDRFGRTKSKGYYRRNTKGVAWFRDDAHEHIARMHDIKRIVEANGYVVRIVQEERIGYVVYSDDLQVIAEPFADTRTDI